MPRPQKEGIDYFPLDVNFFSDKKVKILKARFGADGITIYLYLLCEIYRAGYYIKFDDDALFITSNDLGMSPDKVKQVLKFLLERSLFDNILFQSDTILTSTGIQRRFQLAVKERAKKNPVEVQGFWLLNKTETESFIKVNPSLNKSGKNDSNSGKNKDYSRELSLKESKGKESKEKNYKNITYVPDRELNQAILNYIDYRKSIKKPMTEHAVTLLLKKLNELSGKPSEQIEILNQSIVNGWQGVFPLSEPRGGIKRNRQTSNRFHNLEEHGYDYDGMVWEMINAGGNDDGGTEGKKPTAGTTS